MSRRLTGLTPVVVGLLVAPSMAQVVLTEVLANPSGSEHHEEFVEVSNVGADSVDLAGWRIGDGDELDAIVDAGWGTILAPGRRAVILDASYFGNSAVYDSVREWARIVTIEDRAFGRAGWSNAAPETVLLQAPDGTVADSLLYDPGDAPEGHSWERRTLAPVAWLTSYVPGGTPGRPNSVDQAAAPAGRVEIEVSPDPFGDRLEITCKAPAAPTRLAVSIYRADGVRLVRLRDWEPAALETRLVWDGRDRNGRQVPSGLYIILAQSSADGRVASGKQVVARHR